VVSPAEPTTAPTTPPQAIPTVGPPPARLPAPGRALALWAGFVVVGVAWGTLWVAGAGVALRAAPLMGRWDVHAGWGLAPAVAIGAVVVGWGPRLASRLAWPAVPWMAGLATTLWATALSASDGWARLTAPLTTRHEYEPLAAQIDDLGAFLDSYVVRLGDRPIHVQGHPPGPVVVAWALDRIGLGGAGWLAAVAIAAWGAAVAAALVAARAVAGEERARRAAPALAVVPAAVWAATSLDALFAGLVAGAIALAALAASRGSPPLAVAAGGAGAIALLSTYGAVPLLLVALAVVVAVADRPQALVVAMACAAASVVVLAGSVGFWWPEGLAATGRAYWSGIAAERPGLYLTLVGNPAALALAVGPAVAVGLAGLGPLGPVGPIGPIGPRSRAGDAPGTLARLGGRGPLAVAVRRRLATVPRSWLLPGGALVAVCLADVSQMARGEVERIWLPFVPWLALAAPGDRRWLLAAQVGVALLLESVLVSPW
jgi:hypothetical protein